MNLFSMLFVAMLALATILQLYLAQRQIRHVTRHRDRVPDAFAERIEAKAHHRAADYTVARTRLGMLDTLINAALLLAWTLGGGLQLLDTLWSKLGMGPLVHGIGFILSVFFVSALLELPLSWYRTFHLEQRFGFNRTTRAVFLADLLKQTLLLLALGAPLAALVLWLMGHSGPLWWLYVWAVWTGFGLLMMWAYPAFIAPLFNRFTPLEDSALEARIRALLERCGFAYRGVFVMDGSRRSAHGNAYFTGLGNNKRIVFFDTLLSSLDGEQIEAVLAHELGHFRRHHIRKRFILMALTSAAGMALLGWLINQPWFYSGLGLDAASTHGALVLFLLAAPVFTFFTQPLLAWHMRKHEFEADAFAAQHTDANHLVRALVRLYRDNASTLTPDPLYSAFHDSHPPAPVRIARLLAAGSIAPGHG